MEKRKENKLIIIIGLLFFLIGIGTLIYDFKDDFIVKHNNKKAIKEYYKKEIKKDNNKNEITPDYDIRMYQFIALLKIPEINLEKGIVEKNSIYNNVEYGIELMKESDYPDKVNGDFILASHNGNSTVSYFKNLYKLKIGDDAFVDYNNVTYKYKYVYSYDIPKTGEALIKTSNDKTNLVLITCKGNTNYQTVYIFELVK